MDIDPLRFRALHSPPRSTYSAPLEEIAVKRPAAFETSSKGRKLAHLYMGDDKGPTELRSNRFGGREPISYEQCSRPLNAGDARAIVKLHGNIQASKQHSEASVMLTKSIAGHAAVGRVACVSHVKDKSALRNPTGNSTIIPRLG